jgi:hypothetical protein
MIHLAFDGDDLALLRDEPELLAVADAFRMTQRRSAIARPRRRAAVAAAVVVALTLPALAFSGFLDSLFGFSNPGTSVSTGALDLSDAQILQQHGIDVGRGIKLLATRDGIAFYATHATDGSTCLLSGPAGGTAPTSILIGTPCERDFPSPQQPLLGAYVLVRKPVTTSGKLGLQSVAGLYGLAADGVAAVEAIDANGNVILKAPVTDNVYRTFLDPQHTDISVPAAKIVALNANGNVVYTEAIPQPAFSNGSSK